MWPYYRRPAIVVAVAVEAAADGSAVLVVVFRRTHPVAVMALHCTTGRIVYIVEWSSIAIMHCEKYEKKNEEEEQIEWWTCWRTFVSVSQKEHNKINIIIMHTKLPLHYITLIWLNYRKTIDLTRAVRHRTRLITVTYCIHKKLNANRNDDTHKGRLTCPQMSLSQIEFVDWWSYWILVFNGILGMANESASTV